MVPYKCCSPGSLEVVEAVLRGLRNRVGMFFRSGGTGAAYKAVPLGIKLVGLRARGGFEHTKSMVVLCRSSPSPRKNAIATGRITEAMVSIQSQLKGAGGLLFIPRYSWSSDRGKCFEQKERVSGLAGDKGSWCSGTLVPRVGHGSSGLLSTQVASKPPTI